MTGPAGQPRNDPFSRRGPTAPGRRTVARVICRHHGDLVVHRIRFTDGVPVPVDHPGLIVDRSDLDAAVRSLDGICGHLAAMAAKLPNVGQYPEYAAAATELLSTDIIALGGTGNVSAVMRQFAAAYAFPIEDGPGGDPWAWWGITQTRFVQHWRSFGLRTPRQAREFIAFTGPYDTSPTNATPDVLKAWTKIGVTSYTAAVPWVLKGVNGTNIVGIAETGIASVEDLPDGFTDIVNDVDGYVLAQEVERLGLESADPIGIVTSLMPAHYVGLLRCAGTHEQVIKFVNVGVISAATVRQITGPSRWQPDRLRSSPLEAHDLWVLNGLVGHCADGSPPRPEP